LFFALGALPKRRWAGLFLYFSCAAECHELVQNMNSSEGDFWHAILHRQEPDAANALTGFDKRRRHPVFEELARSAEEIAAKYPAAKFRGGGKWDPLFFIEFCGRARGEPGSATEAAALEIQRANGSFCLITARGPILSRARSWLTIVTDRRHRRCGLDSFPEDCNRLKWTS